MNTTRSMLEGVSNQLVRIYRTVSDEPLDGFVVGVGRKWLLLQVVDDSASFDGYSLVRVADVAEVEGRGPTDRFVRKSLEIRGEWPPRPPAWVLNLDQTSDLMTELSRKAGVLGIYIEEEDPDVLFVGAPFLFEEGALGLREIDSSGHWREDLSQWSYERLTRIDFDGRYVLRLLEVAQLDGTAD